MPVEGQMEPAPLLLQSAGEVYYPDRTAEIQAYRDRMAAYEQSLKDRGFMVRPNFTEDVAENYSLYDIPVEDLYTAGIEFRTNADKLAKTKKNPTAQVWHNPSSTYSLINERGENQVVASGSDIGALDSIYQTARRLSDEGGKKANWKLVETLSDGTTRVMADDDPKSKLGGILDIALPLLGAALVPLTGGLSGALGAAVGGAGGSALSGVAQGKSIGSILKNAAISGGLSYLGSSALSGLGGGTGGLTGGAGTGSLIGNAGGDVLANSLDDIVVTGVKGAAGAGAGALAGAAGGAALGAGAGALLSGGGGGSQLPQDIVVEGSKPLTPTGPVLSPEAIAALGISPAVASQLAAKGSTLDDISKYMQLAGLTTGLVGNVFGGGGGGSGNAGTVPGPLGKLNPVFSAQLPTNPNIPGVGPASNLGARQMPQQDWNTYAMRPEQSFFNYVPQRFAKGGLVVKRRGYAEGGPVEDFGVRNDGTRKGRGFLGVRERPDGDVSTELSIGVEMDGEEVEIPTMVPGLTEDEVDWLLATPPNQQAKTMPQSIVDKAVKHARQRMAQGLSPFAEDSEPEGHAEGGYAVRGEGTGRSDDIEALLSDGEYVIDAETVSLLGDGSSKAGADALDALRVAVRKHKGRKLAKGEFSVKAKKPEKYLKGGKK